MRFTHSSNSSLTRKPKCAHSYSSLHLPHSQPLTTNFPAPTHHPPPTTTTSPLTSSSPKSLESPQTVGEGSFLDSVMVRLAPLSQPQPQPQLRSWSPLIREPWKRRGAGVKGENAEFIAIESPIPSLLTLSLPWCPPHGEESPPLECGREGELSAELLLL